MKLSDLTIKQLSRLYERLWTRMTSGDGYQPFGYDATTLRAVHPSFMRHLDAIQSEAQRRCRAGLWVLGSPPAPTRTARGDYQAALRAIRSKLDVLETIDPTDADAEGPLAWLKTLAERALQLRADIQTQEGYDAAYESFLDYRGNRR
jgi:hypothetical protein